MNTEIGLCRTANTSGEGRYIVIGNGISGAGAGRGRGCAGMVRSK